MNKIHKSKFAEETQELNEETKKEIALARDEIDAGNSHTLTEVKKELGL